MYTLLLHLLQLSTHCSGTITSLQVFMVTINDITKRRWQSPSTGIHSTSYSCSSIAHSCHKAEHSILFQKQEKANHKWPWTQLNELTMICNITVYRWMNLWWTERKGPTICGISQMITMILSTISHPAAAIESSARCATYFSSSDRDFLTTLLLSIIPIVTVDMMKRVTAVNCYKLTNL